MKAANTSPTMGAGEIVGEIPALVPEGEYQLKFEYWQTGVLYGRQPKLTLWFTVVDSGSFFGARLPRHYNVKQIIGKPARGGRFRVGRQCDLIREYARLVTLPVRLDRINLERLESLLIVAQVETVTTDRRQQSIPTALQYSVIRRLVRVEAGASSAFALPAPRPAPVPTSDSLQTQRRQRFAGIAHG